MQHVRPFSFEMIVIDALFLALLDVGSNVLQAASRTVSKDKENDPDAVIEVCRRNLLRFFYQKMIYLESSSGYHSE